MDGLLSRCQFKQAIMTAMLLAQDTNRYLDFKSPWKVIKEDRQDAAKSLYVALSVITQLKTMLHPFLPFSSQRLHQYLGFEGSVEDNGWQWQNLPPGQRLLEPRPLFTKLDEGLAEEETKRLGHV
jgi:methionyl-tRNA synthetase